MLKYGVNTKSAISKYQTLSQEQRFRYQWLSDHFSEMQDLIYASIGCQFSDVSIVYGSKDEVKEAFVAFKGRRESLSRVIKQNIEDHKKSGSQGMEKIIFSYFIGAYSPEYIILLDHGHDYLNNMYNSSNMSWARHKILKLIKYKQFFNVPKYLPLLNHEVTTI